MLIHKKVEQVSGAKHLKEYILSLDTAKHLAMIQRNDKGREVRDYFIEVEKQSRQVKLPSKAELAQMVIESETKLKEERDKRLQSEKKLNIVIHNENTYTATQVAKDINISAKLFNKILVEAGIIYKQNDTYILKAKYQGYGLTSIKETQSKDDKTYISMRWTAKGKMWIVDNFEIALQRASEKSILEYQRIISGELPKIPKSRKK